MAIMNEILGNVLLIVIPKHEFEKIIMEHHGNNKLMFCGMHVYKIVVFSSLEMK